MSDNEQIQALYKDMKHWLSNNDMSADYQKAMHLKYALGTPKTSGNI